MRLSVLLFELVSQAQNPEPSLSHCSISSQALSNVGPFHQPADGQARSHLQTERPWPSTDTCLSPASLLRSWDTGQGKESLVPAEAFSLPAAYYWAYQPAVRGPHFPHQHHELIGPRGSKACWVSDSPRSFESASSRHFTFPSAFLPPLPLPPVRPCG